MAIWGLSILKRHDLDKAEEYYLKSLAIDEQLGRREYAANQYANLGTVNGRRGNKTIALSCWKKSMALYQEIGMEHMAKNSKAR